MKNTLKKHLALQLFILLTLSSCNFGEIISGINDEIDNAEERKIEATKTIKNAEDYTILKNDLSNADKRFAVNGIIELGSAPSVKVYTDIKENEGTFIDSFPIVLGECESCFNVPEKYKNEDIVVYDFNNKKHLYNEKVKFSFTFTKTERQENTVLIPELVRIDAIK